VPALRQWALWALPARAVALVVVVTLAAFAALLVGAVNTSPTPSDLALFLGLLAAGAASVEAVRRVPEPAGMNANDMLAAWSVPIAVLVAPVFSLVAAAALMALTQWRVRRIPVYKRVYSAAAIGLSHAAGSLLFSALPAQARDGGLLGQPTVLVLAVLGVAVVSKVLNAGLIGLAVKGADPEARWREVFVVDRGRLEVTEVCAGVLIAVGVGVSPLLLLVALPPVLLLQRGLLYAQLHAAARTDAKTGLLNAVAWEREAAAALAATRGSRRASAVLLLDIDHFKRVNDTHGHLVGDDVLRGVADSLRGQLRDEHDLLCRFGGEEFAVFLPGVDDDEASRAAERLRRAVGELVTPVDGALVQVTVSVGVTVAHPEADPPPGVPELLARADLGLYRAKLDGRDRVQVLTRPDRRAGTGDE
jgi:diguanylate cyclase (GGDEF)-like protein